MSDTQDVAFVDALAQSNLSEITEGQYAVQQSPTTAVELFGSWMVTDHSNADQMLVSAAGQYGITVPTTADAADQAQATALSQLSGTQFDISYLTDQVQGHEATLQVLLQEIQYGQDPGLVALAQQMLPTIETHLNAAQNLLAVETGSTPPASVSIAVPAAGALPASSAPAVTTPVASNAQDASFVQLLGQANLAEINEGVLALQTAPTTAVQTFGSWMVADHSNANVLLYQAAAAADIGLPTAPSAAQAAQAASLATLTGTAFNSAYLTDQVQGHESTIQVLDAEIQGGQDPQLVALAHQLLPVIDAHLSAAENLLALQPSGGGGALTAYQPSTAQTAATMMSLPTNT